MSRYDNPGSVLLLFGGAAVASIFLILLLNVEARYMKNNIEPEITNGNIFSAMGRQIRKWVIGLLNIDDNGTDSQTSVNGDDVLKYKTRVLQSITEDNRTEDLREHHHIRHRFKHKKKEVHHEVTDKSPFTSPVTVPYMLAEMNTSDPLTSDISQRHLTEQHDQCYTTNDVLFIIGVTCAVNFIFISLIMCVVHICNKEETDLKFEESANFGSRSELSLLLSTHTSEHHQNSPHHSDYVSYFPYVEGYPEVKFNYNQFCNSDLTEHSCKTTNSLNYNTKRLTNAVSMEDLLIST